MFSQEAVRLETNWNIILFLGNTYRYYFDLPGELLRNLDLMV